MLNVVEKFISHVELKNCFIFMDLKKGDREGHPYVYG
jgi:hypothetical protein